MIDTHAHYDDSQFDPDRDELLSSLFQNGIEGIINAGTNRSTCDSSRALAKRYPRMWFAAGLHPEDCVNDPDDFLSWLTPLLNHPKCVAIGEIGLDYHWEIDHALQKRVLHAQLALAAAMDKPVIIHDRDAHADCIEAVLSHPGLRGVFHAYSGSAESALLLQKHGWYFGIGGVVTFKNAEKIKKAVQAISEEFLLLETDCPYLTPVPFRGKRNDSSKMRLTAETIAALRGTTAEHIQEITSENAARLFGLNPKVK